MNYDGVYDVRKKRFKQVCVSALKEGERERETFLFFLLYFSVIEEIGMIIFYSIFVLS